MSDQLLAVEDMAEIPKDLNSAAHRKAGSKGVNLFLARQKLIADMMEQEESEQQERDSACDEGTTTREPEPEACSSRKENYSSYSVKATHCLPAALHTDNSYAMSAAEARKLVSSNDRHVSRPTVIVDSDTEDTDNRHLRISESPPESPQLSPVSNNNDKEISNLHITEIEDEILDPAALPEFSLPKSQLPTITLLQKSREANCNIVSHSPRDMHKIRLCLDGPALYTGDCAGEIPKGALYVGNSDRIEGGFKHTDQFFLLPASVESVERDKSNGAHKSVDNSATKHAESQNNASAKSKVVQKTSNGDIQPEVHRPVHADNSTDTNSVSSSGAEDARQKKSSRQFPGDKLPTKLKPTPPPCMQDKQTAQCDESLQPLLPAVANGVMVSEELGNSWNRHTYSTRTSQDGSEIVSSLSIDTSIGSDNPFTGSAGSTAATSGLSPPLTSPHVQYRDIQKGGEIPFSGLRKPAPITPPPRAEVPKKILTPVAGYNREIVPVPRDQRDRSDAKRRQLLSKIEEDERRKKAREEEAERRSRRHSDYFTLKEKSPIPHDRYDRSFFSCVSAPQSPARSMSSQNSPRSVVSESTRLTAIALYQFDANHPRELNVLKDDRISIIRRIDANWYEAYKDGRSGIIPVSYVQVFREASISPPPPSRPSPPRLREGTAVAKYNFHPQTGAELALRRGDQVSLLRQVDSNWYEGRLQGTSRSGIFPVSYVQVISEPESPAAVDEGCRTAPLINRSQSVPTANYRRGGSLLSPRLSSPLGRKPSSGYGSSDYITSNNNNDHKPKSSRTHNGHITEELDPKPLGISRIGGLEMPSYRSLYNYEPRNEDELDLKVGDIVHVMEKCEDGWFVGASGRTGLFGTFPGNYVAPV